MSSSTHPSDSRQTSFRAFGGADVTGASGSWIDLLDNDGLRQRGHVDDGDTHSSTPGGYGGDDSEANSNSPKGSSISPTGTDYLELLDKEAGDVATWKKSAATWEKSAAVWEKSAVVWKRSAILTSGAFAVSLGAVAVAVLSGWLVISVEHS